MDGKTDVRTDRQPVTTMPLALAVVGAYSSLLLRPSGKPTRQPKTA